MRKRLFPHWLSLSHPILLTKLSRPEGKAPVVLIGAFILQMTIEGRRAVRMTREQLKERVRKLPMQPGVYMHKDKTGKVIYVARPSC